jgi:hypothetical protein
MLLPRPEPHSGTHDVRRQLNRPGGGSEQRRIVT